jgi:hypothetical protein
MHPRGRLTSSYGAAIVSTVRRADDRSSRIAIVRRRSSLAIAFVGEPVVRCPTEAIAGRPTSTRRGSTCASSGASSRPLARGATAECVAKRWLTVRAAGRLERRQLDRELRGVPPSGAVVGADAHGRLPGGASDRPIRRNPGRRRSDWLLWRVLCLHCARREQAPTSPCRTGLARCPSRIEASSILGGSAVTCPPPSTP